MLVQRGDATGPMRIGAETSDCIAD